MLNLITLHRGIWKEKRNSALKLYSIKCIVNTILYAKVLLSAEKGTYLNKLLWRIMQRQEHKHV